ncbi:MAG TPA: 4'-phosphopantetheinyl transferase superfamily protein [Chthoniobacterales bacterium]
MFIERTAPTSITKVLPLSRGERQFEACLALAFAHDYPKLAGRAHEVLAPAEAACFSGFQFEPRRRSYLLGRYAAKLALQQLIPGSSLKALEIGAGVFGQPLVLHPSPVPPDVTISHSGDLAVALAFPAGHPMGVDVEQIDPERLTTIQSVMSARERAWAGHSPREQIILSTLVWTAKEALSKTLFCGLMSPMEIFNLSELRPTGPGTWEGLFENFAQYKFISGASPSYLLSMVLPKRTSCAVNLPFAEAVSQGLPPKVP